MGCISIHALCILKVRSWRASHQNAAQSPAREVKAHFKSLLLFVRALLEHFAHLCTQNALWVLLLLPPSGTELDWQNTAIQLATHRYLNFMPLMFFTGGFCLIYHLTTYTLNPNHKYVNVITNSDMILIWVALYDRVPTAPPLFMLYQTA